MVLYSLTLFNALPFVSLSNLCLHQFIIFLIFITVSEDFINESKLLEFAPNQRSLTVTVRLVDDVFPEGIEEFEVFLSASPGIFIDSPAFARIVILNDDPDLPGRGLQGLLQKLMWDHYNISI